jgi:hypothetical protein
MFALPAAARLLRAVDVEVTRIAGHDAPRQHDLDDPDPPVSGMIS